MRPPFEGRGLALAACQGATKQSAKLAGGFWDPRRLGDWRFRKLGMRTQERDSWWVFLEKQSSKTAWEPPTLFTRIRGIEAQLLWGQIITGPRRSLTLRILWLGHIGIWVAA